MEEYLVSVLFIQLLIYDHIVYNGVDHVSNRNCRYVKEKRAIKEVRTQLKESLEWQRPNERFRPSITVLFDVFFELDPTKMNQLWIKYGTYELWLKINIDQDHIIKMINIHQFVFYYRAVSFHSPSDPSSQLNSPTSERIGWLICSPGWSTSPPNMNWTLILGGRSVNLKLIGKDQIPNLSRYLEPSIVSKCLFPAGERGGGWSCIVPELIGSQSVLNHRTNIYNVPLLNDIAKSARGAVSVATVTGCSEIEGSDDI